MDGIDITKTEKKEELTFEAKTENGKDALKDDAETVVDEKPTKKPYQT